YMDQHRDENPASPSLLVNGTAVEIELERGYARIQRTWQAGDQVQLTLPMPVRRVASHPNLKENAGRVAIERGPLVYCAEQADNVDGMDQYHLPDDAELRPTFQPQLL